MSNEAVQVLVVGGGQAGLAMSEHLRACDVTHLVLERHRIAERWRSERWDSLVANGPAWHDRFPGLEFDLDPDAFASKEQVAEYFEAYAQKIEAPIRCGVEVLSVRRNVGRAGFRAETTDGTIEARYVVAATGAFQQPLIPPILPADAGVVQMHSSGYRNPDQLPDGAVLVVGAGSSGVQIADELRRAGRSVYLSRRSPRPSPAALPRPRLLLVARRAQQVGRGGAGARRRARHDRGQRGAWRPHRRLPRPRTPRHHARRVHDLVRRMARSGSRPTSRRTSRRATPTTSSLLDEADAYVARAGLDLPEEPEAHELGPLPAAALDPVRELDLAGAGVTSVIWATGFTSDYSWLQVDAFDENGKPDHRRGVSSEPGVYFLGLPWQSRRGSTFIWGVWHDARHVADHIATQNGYLAYEPSASTSRSDEMAVRA